MSRPSFAVVLTWPELENAEYEVVQRICRAASNIGALAWVVDNDGYVLWSNADDVTPPTRRLTRQDCAFVLSLHFESPRLYDIPTYAALWNPPDFYLGFGYGRTVAQLASHVDLLSCRSAMADAHAVNIYEGLGRSLQKPFPPFFHGVPQPYLEPQQSGSSRLFYVGINWERVTGEKGRHHDLLRQLDSEDLVSIYGPEKLFGVAVWRGFATYRGSIPFDGESVVARINEAGICLALSSRAHQVSGIMSNRLFEALAAGAVVIANPHPLIDRYFADVVYVVDDRKPVDEMIAEIRGIVLNVRTDPAAARARAKRGQERLAEGFSLEDNLQNLFAVHADRLAHFTRETMGETRHEISVIVDATGADAAAVRTMLATVAAQTGVTVDLLVLGAADTLDHLPAERAAIRSAQVIPVELGVIEEGKAFRRSGASGLAFAQALAAVRTPFFCTMQSDDRWFGEHLASLAHMLDRTPESSFACSGKLDEKADEDGILRRRFESLTFEHLEALAEAAYPRDAGRFLFRSTLIPKLPLPAFSLLDMLEHRLLKLWALLGGPLAQTHYATYVRALDVTAGLPLPLFPEAQQQEVVRDTVRGRQDWLMLVSTLRQYRPQPVVETKPAALTLGLTYAMRKGGDGLALLKEGFSTPEENGIWIEGRRGELAFEIADAATPERAEIVFQALARAASADGAPQSCSVGINGQVAGRVVVGAQPARFHLPVPATVDLHAAARVTFRLGHAEQVLDEAGTLVDERRLGLQLLAFGIAAATPAPRLALDRMYVLKEGGDGMPFAAEGFAYPEPDILGVYGPVATFAFTLEAGEIEANLILTAACRDHARVPQVCTVSLDGSVVGQVSVSAELQQSVLALPPMHGGRPYRLTLGLSGPEGSDPAGLALHQFGLLRPAPRGARRLGRALARRLR